MGATDVGVAVMDKMLGGEMTNLFFFRCFEASQKV